MGFFSVLRPCVVGKLHYATVPSQPIEVDDVVAAPLVESGDLATYRPGGSRLPDPYVIPTEDEVVIDVEPDEFPAIEEQDDPEKPSPRPRNPRRPKA